MGAELREHFEGNRGRRIDKWLHYFEIYDRHFRHFRGSDVHTSYLPEFGGGYREPGSFIEFTKSLVDRLHGWHSRDGALTVDDFTRSAHSIHFYDSVVVIEKRPMFPPEHHKTGRKSF